MSMKNRTSGTRVTEHLHGRYLIKAGILHDAFVARAFPKPPSRFRHLVAEASGPSIQAAIDKLIVRLEALREERRANRRFDPRLPFGVPTSEEYADALRSLSPGVKLLGLLHDHASSRRRGLALRELAAFGDDRSVQVLLKAYAKLGVQIAGAIEPDDVPTSGLPVILSMQDETTVEPGDIVSLQPELQDAVLRLLGPQRMTS